MIDTHSHLVFKEYDKDREETLKRAWEAGLEALIVIGSGEGLDGNAKAVKFAEQHENVFAAVGIHPHDAEKGGIDKAVAKLKMLAKSEKVVAVGEIGLDYFREHSSKESQLNCFKRFLELASELKLPISIHDREAHKDILYTLRESRYESYGGVFHCFSGDIQMAREVLDLGYYIAITGVVTFKKADELKKVVKEIPVERLVLETDCPYLAPVPFRGKRNEPAHVKYVAEEVAKIKGLSVEDVSRITTINARRAFNLPGMIPVGKIVYPIRKSLYINLTNRCTLSCAFCPKKSGSFEVKGHNLKLSQEPDVEDVFRAIGNSTGYDEVVFCGFGEPTLRFEVLKVVAKQLKDKGMRVRIDTDGLVNLVYGRDVLPELSGFVDAVSVSMNAPDPETYIKLCPSKHGELAFHAMVAFLKKAKEFIPDVTATAVGVPGLNVAACEKLAKELGVNFRLRINQEVG